MGPDPTKKTETPAPVATTAVAPEASTATPQTSALAVAAPATPTEKEISDLIKEIQTELKAGRYDASASVLSTVVGTRINSDQLKIIIEVANGNNSSLDSLESGYVNIRGKEAAINNKLRENGYNGNALSAKTIEDIANIATLPPEKFKALIDTLAPNGGLDRFGTMAMAGRTPSTSTPVVVEAGNPNPAAPATAPTGSSALAAASAHAARNQPPASEKKEEDPFKDFSLMKLLTDKDYRQEMGAKLVLGLAQLKEFATELMNGDNPMMAQLGGMLKSLIGGIEPMVSSLAGVGKTSAPQAEQTETAQAAPPPAPTTPAPGSEPNPTADGAGLAGVTGILSPTFQSVAPPPTQPKEPAPGFVPGGPAAVA